MKQSNARTWARVQVVLQGLGQGFFSTGFPAITMVAIVMLTWSLEGHYGLALLSSSSVSGTGFQGGIASYGAALYQIVTLI